MYAMHSSNECHAEGLFACRMLQYAVLVDGYVHSSYWATAGAYCVTRQLGAQQAQYAL
jgi:hypothetical protein